MEKSPANSSSELNASQMRAVLQTEGPVLVLAGAGAGKTKTIVARIVHLIERGVEPGKILAITFTNKAAGEMRQRVVDAIQNTPSLNRPVSLGEAPLVSTFHSFAASLLRENARLIGLPRHFAIYDRTDSKSAIKESIKEIGIDPKQIEPGKILSVISRAKGNLQTASDLASEDGDYGNALVARIWERYDARLAKEKALDFDDLLSKSRDLLQQNPAIRTLYQNKFEYIHVDEYQDTNRVQYALLELLTENHKNIFVVGDTDQTIYTWRGAYIKNLLNFDRDFPGTTIIMLEENYRSTKNILAAANAVIKKNKIRYEKNLYTKNDDGEPIGLYAAYDETDEASFVARKITSLLSSGVQPGSIGVLYRANFQSRVLEQAFLESDIPYQVIGVRFFERREIKDILAYLRAALDPENLSDVKRIINTPPRGIGKLTLLKVLAKKEKELPAAAQQKVRNFFQLLQKIRSYMQSNPPSKTIKTIIDETGMSESLRRGGPEDMERLENLKELVSFATKYDALPPQEAIERLLTDASLASDQDELKEKENRVRLMTIHASKGLEFDYVFITGLEQDLFPTSKIEQEGIPAEEREEERRLFYVALTRARKKVFLTYGNVRTIYGSRQVNVPSEFLQDIESAAWEAESHEHGGSGKTILF